MRLKAIQKWTHQGLNHAFEKWHAVTSAKKAAWDRAHAMVRACLSLAIFLPALGGLTERTCRV